MSPARRALSKIRWRLPATGAGDAVGDALSPACRLAIVYLALPVLVWLLGWFEWWFGVPAAALLAAGLWRALTGRGGDVQAVRRLAVVALPLALGCVMLLPPGGLVDPTGTDWVAHRAVFLDLARGDWPTYLPDYASNEPPLLRYYLGYFIVPGLIAKWLGVDALHWAVPLWTWGGLALIVALAAEGLPTRRATLLAAAVLVFFSGMDVVEHVLRDGLPAVARRLVEQFGVDGLAFIRSPSSAEWVAYHAYGIGDLASLPAPASPLFLEYLSNVHVFSVSPQHFIGGGLTTLLMLRLGEQPRFLAVSGIVLASCLFWSSLLCVGLLPLAGALLLKNGLRPFLGWRNLLLAPALAALLALYLASGQVDFPRGWLWQLYASGAQLAVDVGFFYLAEFLALALVLWWLQPKLGREPFFVVAVVVLLAAPWFWYGGPRFNEFHRVAIPSLFVLAYFAARVVAECAPAGGAGRGGEKRWIASDLSGRAVFALLVAVLGVGATTAVYDFARNVGRFGAIPYARTGYTLTTDVDAVTVAQKTAYRIPTALGALLRDNDRGNAGRGELLLRAEYNVYRDGKWLVYVIDDCTLAPRAARFRLRAFAGEHAVGDDLSVGHYRANGNFGDRRRNGSADCVERARLPDYPVARIHTGQFMPAGEMIWGVGYDFTTKKPFGLAGYYRARYEALAFGAPPADRGHFDVHASDAALDFTKAPCGVADTAPRFFLHIVPAATGDLPRHRRRYGFDNLDFDFGERGALFDGKCLATVRLPDYDIQRVRAGQRTRAEKRILWQVEFAPQAKALGAIPTPAPLAPTDALATHLRDNDGQ